MNIISLKGLVKRFDRVQGTINWCTEDTEISKFIKFKPIVNKPLLIYLSLLDRNRDRERQREDTTF